MSLYLDARDRMIMTVSINRPVGMANPVKAVEGTGVEIETVAV